LAFFFSHSPIITPPPIESTNETPLTYWSSGPGAAHSATADGMPASFACFTPVSTVSTVFGRMTRPSTPWETRLSRFFSSVCTSKFACTTLSSYSVPSMALATPCVTYLVYSTRPLRETPIVLPAPTEPAPCAVVAVSDEHAARAGEIRPRPPSASAPWRTDLRERGEGVVRMVTPSGRRGTGAAAR